MLFTYKGECVFSCIDNVSQNGYILVRWLRGHPLINLLLLFTILGNWWLIILFCSRNPSGCNSSNLFRWSLKFYLVRLWSPFVYFKLISKQLFIFTDFLGWLGKAETLRRIGVCVHKIIYIWFSIWRLLQQFVVSLLLLCIPHHLIIISFELFLLRCNLVIFHINFFENLIIIIINKNKNEVSESN